MKNKDREVLVEELNKLRKYIDANAFLKAKYPNLEGRVDEVYQGILYDKVDAGIDLDEDGDGGSKRVQQLEKYCIGIKSFISDISSLTGTSKEGEKFLSYEVISANKSAITAFLGSGNDAAFDSGKEEMIAFVNGISTGLTIQELLEGLVKVLNDAYVDVKFEAIEKTRNFKLIKQLNIPVLNNFIDNQDKYETPPTAPYTGERLKQKIVEIFSASYVMNEGDFDQNVKSFVDDLKSKISNLVKHTYEKCEIAVDVLSKSIGGKIAAAGTHPLFKEIQTATEKAIRLASNGTLDIWSDYAKSLMKSLDGVQSVFATVDKLTDVNEPDFFAKKLKAINLSTSFVDAVNRNSPYFIVGQPNFPQKFEQELNTWKEEMISALGVASKVVADLDGATFDGSRFKEEVLKLVNQDIQPLAKAFANLNIPTLKLREHTDISEFNEKWIVPWSEVMQKIDIASILASEDVILKVELYKNKYAHLPLPTEIQSALLLAVTDKVNLALEQARKNEKEIRKNRQAIKENSEAIRENKVAIDKNGKAIEETKAEVLVVKEKVDENSEKIDHNTKLIEKLDLKSKDINVDIDIVIEAVEINEVTQNLLARFDKEWEKEIDIFKYDSDVTLYTATVFFVELGFGASASLGVKAEAKASELKADLTGYANVKGYVELSASIGVDCFFFKLKALELSLGISLKAEAFVNGQIYVSKGPGITAAIKAGFVVEAEAYFKVKAVAGLFESDEIKLSGVIPLFAVTTPQFSLTWTALPSFKFAGAKKTKGQFTFGITPELKASLSQVKNDGEARDKEAASAQR